jgi:hypothetical protein
MKIPDAYFSAGLGQRVAPVPTFARPDASGDVAIGQAGERLGATILGAATDAIEFQGRQELQAANEYKNIVQDTQKKVDAQFATEQEALNRATAQDTLVGVKPATHALIKQLSIDPQYTPDQLTKAYTENSQKIIDDFAGQLTPEQRVYIDPHLKDLQAEGLIKIGDIAFQKMREATLAKVESSTHTVVNDETRTREDKLKILNTPGRYDGTGLSAQAVSEKLSHAEQTIDNNSAATDFNATRENLADFQAHRQKLEAKDANGNYTYLPGWDQKERQQYVRMSEDREKNLLNQEKQRQAAAQAAVRQEASNLVTEYKDKVNTGWVPISAADYKFQSAVRNAASLSPSLARQYETATSMTTDLSKRLEMKQKDRLGITAAENGYTLAPINVLDVAGIPKQIAGRMAVAQKLGVKEIFLGPEMKAISEQLATLPPQQQIQFMSGLSAPMGSAIAAATWNTAAEQVRQQRPDQATMFKLFAQGKPAQAQLYSEGRAYLSGEKKDFLKEKFTTVQSEIGDQLKKSLGTAFTALPQTRNTIDEAIATIYLATAQRKNIGLDKVDKDVLEGVVRDVVGGTVRTGSAYYGSGKTTVAPQGMKPDQFLNSIKAITPDDIAKRGGVMGMTDSEAAAYIKKIAWHEGNGGYTFVKDGAALYGKNGKPFTWGW